MPEVPVVDATAGATQTSQSTLDTLGAKVSEYLTAQKPVVPATVPPVTPIVTPPQPTPAAAGGQTPPVGATATPKPAEADLATVQRLQQEVARYNKVLQAVGLPPDSAILDHFQKGLLTADDVRAEIASRLQPKPSPANQTVQPAPAPQPAVRRPVVPLDQQIAQLNTAVEQLTKGQGDVDADTARQTIAQLASVVNQLAGTVRVSQERDERSALQDYYTQCINATSAAASASEQVKALPDELRSAANQLILGATDIAVSELAPQIGADRAHRPETYGVVAKDVTGRFDALMAHVRQAAVNEGIELGKKAMLANIHQNPNEVTPVSPASAGQATVVPQERLTLEQLPNLVAAYLQKSRQQA